MNSFNYCVQIILLEIGILIFPDLVNSESDSGSASNFLFPSVHVQVHSKLNSSGTTTENWTNLTHSPDSKLNFTGKIFKILGNSERERHTRILLSCSAKCPIQWLMNPVKENLTDKFLKSLDVGVSRSATDGYDNSTFIFTANLTIDEISDELSGIYYCGCINNPNFHSNIFLYLEAETEKTDWVEFLFNIGSDFIPEIEIPKKGHPNMKMDAKFENNVSLCCHKKESKGFHYDVPRIKVYNLRNEATFILVQPLMGKLILDPGRLYIDTNGAKERLKSDKPHRNQCSYLEEQDGWKNSIRATLCNNRNRTEYYANTKDLLGNSHQSLADRVRFLTYSTNYIQTTSSPNVYLTGERGNIKCFAHASHFAHGLRWIIDWKNGTRTQVENPSTVIEMERTGIPVFYSEYNEPMDPNVTRIMCYAPHWKVYHWGEMPVQNVSVIYGQKPSVLINGTSALELYKGQSNVPLECIFETIGLSQITWSVSNATTNREISSRNYSFEKLVTFAEIYKLNFTGDETVGNYTCKVSNVRGSDEKTFVVRHNAYEPPKIQGLNNTIVTWTLGEIDKFISCGNVTGKPTPEIIWTKNHTELPESDIYTIQDGELIFSEVSLKAQGSYACNARNPYGTASRSFDVNVNQPKGGLSLAWILIIVFGSAAFMTFGSITLCHYIQRIKRNHMILAMENLINRYDGGVYIDTNGKVVPAPMPYDFAANEVKRHRLKIGTRCLGSGNFGRVMIGTLEEIIVIEETTRSRWHLFKRPKKQTQFREVAVKLPVIEEEVVQVGPGGEINIRLVSENELDDCQIESFESLISEMKVLAFLKKCGEHENIIKFYGACLQDMKNREVYVLMEFCQNGDLKSYLTAHNKDFTPDKQNNSSDNLLTFAQLRKWCWEIAKGLQFLFEHRLLHIDLSAKNILLDAQNIPKISDFGHARQLKPLKDNYPKRKLNQQLPVLWMSFEALKYNIFSPASDMWSFGVVVWEICTLGVDPKLGYGIRVNNLIGSLKGGGRLPRPGLATQATYDLMSKCWKLNPDERPTIAEILEYFDPSNPKTTVVEFPQLIPMEENNKLVVQISSL